MEYRDFGRTGMRVSVLGFGGAEIGFQNATVEDVEALLGSALDAGLNVIDTAECYNTSEELIGRAVGHRRGDYLLFTKCGHSAGLAGADWDPAMLQQSIDRSLRRLQTDCVDLLQLHSCSKEILQRGEVVEVIQAARDAGKTRFIGYSGDGEDALWAVESGLFDALQTSVNIADQEVIDRTLPKAAERAMGVIAKRPIANAVWLHRSRPAEPYHHAYWDRLQELDYPFLQQDAAASIGTALRFTLSQQGVATAIVGTRKPGRWQENAAYAALGPLPEAEIQAIRARWAAVARPDWEPQV